MVYLSWSAAGEIERMSAASLRGWLDSTVVGLPELECCRRGLEDVCSILEDSAGLWLVYLSWSAAGEVERMSAASLRTQLVSGWFT